MGLQSLRELSHEIEKIYSEMGEAFSHFQNQSNLACLPQCGACCLAPTVEASALEMLPLALHLLDEGRAQEVLESLLDPPPSCIFYKKLNDDGSKGFCGVYQKRPSLCRVFGAGARLNKAGVKELSLCKKIKEAHPAFLNQDISEAPLMGLWKSRVRNLSFALSIHDQAINLSLREALEKVLLLADLETPDPIKPVDKVS